MPELSRFLGIVIYMYYRDHGPAHFHAEYGEHEAMIDIQKLELMEGYLPHRALGLVLDWAELHRSELMRNWELCQTKQAPNKIKPLS